MVDSLKIRFINFELTMKAVLKDLFNDVVDVRRRSFGRKVRDNHDY